MVDVARAGINDLEQLVEIARRRREEYATYQPRFWHPAPDAVDRQRAFVRTLLGDPEVVVLVARDGTTVRGLAIARLVPAPPVYDPGGPSCVVDDFTVAYPAEWSTVGPLLLGAIRAWGAECGAVQLVVVTAQRDDPKRAVLDAAGLSTASEWWVGPTA